MIIRAVDGAGDWLFGKGLNDYKSANAAIAQDIQNNLSMFLGDCFFALSAGIDWWNLLSGKNEIAINLAVNSAILSTSGVTGILQTSISLDANRNLQIQYQVQTIYSTLQNTYVYNVGTL